MLTLQCVRLPQSSHPVLPSLAQQSGNVGSAVCAREAAANHFCSLKEPDLQLRESFSAAARFQNPENKNAIIKQKYSWSLENPCEVKQSLIAIEERAKVCLGTSVGINWIAVGNKVSRFSGGYIPNFKNKYLFGRMYWGQAKHRSVAAQNERTCSQALLLHLCKFISFEQGAGWILNLQKKRNFLWPLGSVTVNIPNLKPFVSNSVKPLRGPVTKDIIIKFMFPSSQAKLLSSATSLKPLLKRADKVQTTNTVGFSEAEWIFQ